MSVRKFAFLSGAFFLLVGLVAFIPNLSTFPEWLPRLKLEASYGLFLNIFPVNIINKTALILFGIAGLAVGRNRNSESSAILYSRTVFIVMGLAAILGMIPQTDLFFGYWPLFGGEVWFHGISALISAYYGYSKHSIEVTRQTHARV